MLDGEMARRILNLTERLERLEYSQPCRCPEPYPGPSHPDYPPEYNTGCFHHGELADPPEQNTESELSTPYTPKRTKSHKTCASNLVERVAKVLDEYEYTGEEFYEPMYVPEARAAIREVADALDNQALKRYQDPGLKMSLQTPGDWLRSQLED